MNSETQNDIRTNEIKLAIVQKESQEKADSKTRGEADLAKSFEGNNFWQIMKKDLEGEVEKMVEIILREELSK